MYESRPNNETLGTMVSQLMVSHLRQKYQLSMFGGQRSRKKRTYDTIQTTRYFKSINIGVTLAKRVVLYRSHFATKVCDTITNETWEHRGTIIL